MKNASFTEAETHKKRGTPMQRIKDFWNKNRTSKIIIIVVAIILLCCSCSILVMVFPPSEVPISTPNADAIYTETAQTITAEYQKEESTVEPVEEAITPEFYVEKYGGKAEVYAEIMASEDCTTLQETFDRAVGNNEVAVNNNDEFKRRYTLGYMTVSDERMREIGCYE